MNMLPLDLTSSGLLPPAYLDPGTGSLIIQVLIGVAVGGLLIGKLFWFRIKFFFKGLFSTGSKQSEDEE